MSQQARLTLYGATLIALMIVAVTALVGGNSLASPEVDLDREVLATGATPTTISGDTVAADQPPADEDGDEGNDDRAGGFLLPEGVGEETTAPELVSPPSETTPPAVETTTSTTTTVPPPVVDADGGGRSILLQEGLMVLGDGTSSPVVVRFGTSATEAIEASVNVLGKPTSDTGAMADDDCAGFTTRKMRFDGLEIVLSERTEGTFTFEQWFVDGPITGGLPIETEDGLTTGMTVADLSNVNSEIVVFTENGSGSFKMPDDSSNSPVWGRTSGDDATDAVNALWSGNECARVAG